MTSVWDHYAAITAPNYDPFKASRNLLVSGRGYGKSAAAEGYRRALAGPSYFHAIYDEIQAIMIGTDQLRRIVAGWRMAPPQPFVPAIGSARWACTSPTGEPPLDRMAERWAKYTRDITDGLAGRAYTETRQEAWLRNIITDAVSKVRAQ